MSHTTTEANSRIRRGARRGITVTLAAAAAALLLAIPAAAAQPNQQACLGEDIRLYAQGGSEFGAFVRSLTDGGVGTEIQAHLAGLVHGTSCQD